MKLMLSLAFLLALMGSVNAQCVEDTTKPLEEVEEINLYESPTITDTLRTWLTIETSDSTIEKVKGYCIRTTSYNARFLPIISNHRDLYLDLCFKPITGNVIKSSPYSRLCKRRRILLG